MSGEEKLTKQEIEGHPDALMCGACKEAFLPKLIAEYEREVDVVDMGGDKVPICPWCRDRLIGAGVLTKTV